MYIAALPRLRRSPSPPALHAKGDGNFGVSGLGQEGLGFMVKKGLGFRFFFFFWGGGGGGGLVSSLRLTRFG